MDSDQDCSEEGQGQHIREMTDEGSNPMDNESENVLCTAEKPENGSKETEELSIVGKASGSKTSTRTRSSRSLCDSDVKECKQKMQQNKLSNEVKSLKKQNEKLRQEVADLNIRCTSLDLENARF